MKHITVAQTYAIFEVPDETWEVLSSGAMQTPPIVVLEVMVLNGQAKKIGTIGTLSFSDGEIVDEDEDELPDDGSSLFDEDTEEDDES